MAISHSGPIVLATAIFCASCTTVPPFVPFQRQDASAVGPKIASVEAGLKCGLWQAANNNQVLTFYDDGYYANGTELVERNPGLEHKSETDTRAFTLKNLFGEIEYIAEYQLTLDVVDTGAFNPIIAFSRPYSGTIGDLPATGILGAVGGSFSEAAHQYLTLYQSVDFSRLIAAPPLDGEPSRGPGLAIDQRRSLPVGATPCDPRPDGAELASDLRLAQPIATAITAMAMNDIALFPPSGQPSAADKVDQAAKEGAVALPPKAAPVTKTVTTLNNNPAGLSNLTEYTFGAFTAQIDFTIIENGNGGPTWTLKYFKGPGTSNNGLINLNRQVKDTLLISFAPVCIRSHRVIATVGSRYEYQPEMMVGTPGWANYLPPCDEVGQQSRVRAAAAARYLNLVKQNAVAIPP